MATGNAQYLNEHDVRMWLRDNCPESNTLINDYEFSKEEIVSAMTYCQDYWNELPPYVGNFDYTVIPFRFHLLQGTCAQLLYMAGHQFRRNALNYSAGGLTVQDQEKAEVYDTAATRLWEQYKAWVQQNKHAINVGMGWGYA